MFSWICACLWLRGDGITDRDLKTGAAAKELVIKPVDAIITSPPYPGVYDYMAAVEDAAMSLGLRCLKPGYTQITQGPLKVVLTFAHDRFAFGV